MFFDLVTKLSSTLLIAQESNAARQVLGKRKASFIEEVGNPREECETMSQRTNSNLPSLAPEIILEKKDYLLGTGL